MECKLDKLNSIPSKELLSLYSSLFHSLLLLKVLVDW